jgi:hypothetical protein
VAALITAIAAGFMILYAVHNSLVSLQILNTKMNDIMSAKVLEDLIVQEDQKSCYEIAKLYELFKDLISNKRFTNNNFFGMPDAFAVIDLAESCNMFSKINNYKATGVCYNNIANY